MKYICINIYIYTNNILTLWKTTMGWDGRHILFDSEGRWKEIQMSDFFYMNLFTNSSYMPHAIPALNAFLVSLMLNPLNNLKAVSFFIIDVNVLKELVNFDGSNCILVFMVSNGAVTVVAKLADNTALVVFIVVEVYVVNPPSAL